MTKAEFQKAEKRVIQKLKRVSEKRPDTKRPNTVFKRDWAYGNAGLENDKITRQQVDRAIKK